VKCRHSFLWLEGVIYLQTFLQKVVGHLRLDYTYIVEHENGYLKSKSVGLKLMEHSPHCICVLFAFYLRYHFAILTSRAYHCLCCMFLDALFQGSTLWTFEGGWEFSH